MRKLVSWMLSTQLRPYQQTVVDKLDEQIKAGKRSLVIPLPTGAGKTVIGAYLLDRAKSQGLTGWFATHTVILAAQTVDRFAEYGLTTGLVQADNTRDEHEPILVTAVQTIQARDYARIGKRLPCSPDKCNAKCDGRVCDTLYSESFPDDARVPQILIIDECDLGFKYIRRAARKVLENGGIVIGLTATPYSNFMSLSYEAVIECPTMDALTGEGAPLVPMRAWESSKVFDMTSDNGKPYKPNGEGDYTSAQLDKGFRSELLGDVPEVWKEKTADLLEAEGKPPQTIVIVSRKKEGRLIADLLNERTEYKAELTSADDGHNGNATTDEILARWKSGETTFLVAIDKVGRGFDVPSVMVIVLIRPIASPSLFVQVLGRVVRSDEGKTEARVIDCGGNFDRLMSSFRRHFYQGPDGFAFPKPVEPRDERKPRVCPVCKFALIGYPEVCPECKTELTQSVELAEFDAEVFEVNLGPTPLEEEFWASNDLDVEALQRFFDRPDKLWQMCLANAAHEKDWMPVAALIASARHDFATMSTPIDHIECTWTGFKKCTVAKTVPGCGVYPDDFDMADYMRSIRCEIHDHRPAFPGSYHYHIGSCLPRSPMPESLKSLLVVKRAIRRSRDRLYEPSSVRCACCGRFAQLRWMRTNKNKYGYVKNCPECRAGGVKHDRCSGCRRCRYAVRKMTEFVSPYGRQGSMLMDHYCERCQPW